MDWIGNGDHDNGAGREYTWWLTQKTTDAYHVADRFTPMFTYERSVAYPHGHRNVMFAQRGVRTLPRLAEPDHGQARGRRPRRRYQDALPLPEGVRTASAPATPAPPSMGTDWRDNDPEVEPIVEIYQGDRMSYEKRGGAAGRLRSQERQEARQHRRLVSARLRQPRPGQGLSPRLPVVQRSLLDAHLLLHRPGREARPRRRSSPPSRSATATPRPTTSSSTSAAATTSWATSSRATERRRCRSR